MNDNQTAYALRFAVDTRPVCIWVRDPRERARQFLSRVTPEYFDYVGETHAGQLDTEFAHSAALALRTTYSQALEAFMAFAMAALQAPECPYAWLVQYKNHELSSLVTKVSHGQAVHTRLRKTHVDWDGLARALLSNLRFDDQAREDAIKAGFGSMWQRFAYDFKDDAMRDEYNSIKHGLRAAPGGFSLAVGPQEAPDIPCPPERMKSLGGSEYGSTYFLMENLHGNKFNFSTRKHMRNWMPENLANGLHMISMSMRNILATLRVLNGESAELIQFVYPTEIEAFDLPWKQTPGVHASSFDLNVRVDEEQLLTPEQILASYDDPAPSRD